MAPRRPSGKAMLAAAAAALVAFAGIGAAAWVAASDDDGSPKRDGSVASAVEPTDSVPTVPPDSEPPATPALTEREAPPDDPQPPSEPNETTTGGTQKTRFPPERRQRQDDPPKREFAIPPAREFSGTGNATLGTVNLRQNAIVRWTTKGSHFELRFGREAFPIIAPSPSGQLVVPPYNFERVRVIARGRWTISITPQK